MSGRPDSEAGAEAMQHRDLCYGRPAPIPPALFGVGMLVKTQGTGPAKTPAPDRTVDIATADAPRSSNEPPAEYVFTPRDDLQPWSFRLPLDWDADPFHDRNWRF